MIESIRIRNFRGFKDIRISPLSQITLISGKNNAGKSSVLEAIFLLLAHTNDAPFAKLEQFRGISRPAEGVTYSIWEDLFHKMDIKNAIKIAASIDGEEAVSTFARDSRYRPSSDVVLETSNGRDAQSSANENYALKTSFSMAGHKDTARYIVSGGKLILNRAVRALMPEDKSPRARFINSFIANTDSASLAEWFSSLELAGSKDKIIETMRIIEPHTNDISTIAQNGSYQLYVKIGDDRMPLKLAGDGMNRMLFIMLSILAHPQSVILIDEIETGFHYSMYAKLWEVAACAARANGCQIIATTHSYECIMGATDGTETAQMADRFSYYRIDREQDNVFIYHYPHDMVSAACDGSVEVR